MSFSFVGERLNGSASVGSNGYVATRVFRVRSDDNAASEVQALAAPEIPQYGQLHPQINTLTVNGVSARRVDERDHAVFEVTVNYGTPSGGSSQGTADPLDEPASISWGSRAVELVAWQTPDGILIVNSAGDPFDPPIMTTEMLPVVTVIRNVRTFKPDLAAKIGGTVNASPVSVSTYTIPEGKGMLEEYSGERIRQGKVTYWRETIRIVINSSDVGWEKVVADVGWRDSTGKRNTDADGADLPNPGNLTAGLFTDEADSLKFQVYRLEYWPLGLANI